MGKPRLTNVIVIAEKPSVARAFVKAFSVAYGLTFKKRKGDSRYNPIYTAQIEETEKISISLTTSNWNLTSNDSVIVSSVTGHVLSYDYPPPYDKSTSWKKTNPAELLTATAEIIPISDALAKQIKKLGEGADLLVILTDIDAVYTNFNKENAQPIREMDMETARRYLDAG